MLALKTILAPVDFSEQSEMQIEMAANLARHFDSRVVLLHVIPMFGHPHPTDPAAARAYQRKFEDEIRGGVEQALEEMAGRMGIEGVETAVRSGDPAMQIDCVAKQIGADVVVLPTAGRGLFRQSSIGSVTRRALLDMDCPVMTGVHAKRVVARDAHPYRRIGWLATLQPGDDKVLAWARDFAAAYDAELRVLHALPWLESLGKRVPEHVAAELIGHARERIDKMLQEAGVNATVDIRLAPFESAFYELLKAANADVIVTSRRRAETSIGIFGPHVEVTEAVRLSPRPIISV
jgi:nucleotide-binding universal stress UspA family protein